MFKESKIRMLNLCKGGFKGVKPLQIYQFGIPSTEEPKEPTTPQELVQEAETKTRQGKYEEAIALYNRAMEKIPASVELANAYWGRGAAHLQQYTRLRTRERTLKLKAQTDISIAGDYAKIAQIAAQEFNQGMADHQKAAQIAELSGLGSCAAAIRETVSRAQDGMLRYNNAYLLYLLKVASIA